MEKRHCVPGDHILIISGAVNTVLDAAVVAIVSAKSIDRFFRDLLTDCFSSRYPCSGASERQHTKRVSSPAFSPAQVLSA